MSEPGETRTLDPRIKSALLYRLSYRLNRDHANQTVNQHRDTKPRHGASAYQIRSVPVRFWPKRILDAIDVARSRAASVGSFASATGALLNRICIALIAIAILAGTALRTARLGTVPLGLHPDEACEGYDAYSILETGRDHRGHFMPLAMESFHDYRMPLSFWYSLVPLVANIRAQGVGDPARRRAVGRSST